MMKGVNMTVKPISPNDVGLHLANVLPDKVIETWNTLIAQSQSSGGEVEQREAIKALMEATGSTRDEVFAKHWLDIELMYRAQGWKVIYDKPAYNESYEPTFIFSPK